ncbi:MAG: hypothetical protein AAF747_06550 [Planctomycetota bacterium]
MGPAPHAAQREANHAIRDDKPRFLANDHTMRDDAPDFEPLDPEGPSEADLERFGDEYVTCPVCKADVYDQSVLCPSCGHALNDAASGMPAWAIVTALLAAAVLIVILIS